MRSMNAKVIFEMLTKFGFFPKIAVYYKKLIKIIIANYANKYFW